MDPAECVQPDVEASTSGNANSANGGACSTDDGLDASAKATVPTTEPVSDATGAPENARKRRISAIAHDGDGDGAKLMASSNGVCAKRRAPNVQAAAAASSQCGLLQLSDEVLLDILKHLDSISLERLGE